MGNPPTLFPLLSIHPRSYIQKQTWLDQVVSPLEFTDDFAAIATVQCAMNRWVDAIGQVMY
jgi:hypothetical protein